MGSLPAVVNQPYLLSGKMECAFGEREMDGWIGVCFGGALSQNSVL